MRLLVIRHALAEPFGAPNIKTDFHRPLMPEGIEQCKVLAKWLSAVEPELERMLVSPLLRTQQTAEHILLNKGEHQIYVETQDWLSTENGIRSIAKGLQSQNCNSLAIVGHEPDLSELVAWLVGRRSASIQMEKAAIAALEISDNKIKKGSGTLNYLISADLLSRYRAF
jgi:phosphohistidine phosphatase